MSRKPGEMESGRLTRRSLTRKFIDNRGNNRGDFELPPEFVEFCPKSANSAPGQGNNREFCGYLTNPASLLTLMPVLPRIQEIIRELPGKFRGNTTFPSQLPGFQRPTISQPVLSSLNLTLRFIDL